MVITPRNRKSKTLRRVHVPGAVYFVTATTRHREPILVGDRAGAVVEAFERLRGESRAHVLAFVVMPDHIHALLIPLAEGHIGDPMKFFKRVAGNQIRRSGHAGRAWEARFYDRVIRDRAELDAAVEYIDTNPVQAGLCEEPTAWPWSTAACIERWDLEKVAPT
ncbi:MAG TPA: transposase [Thermoleophilia bacterium]|nr:transposase [Thermoleophilia bacterium]